MFNIYRVQHVLLSLCTIMGRVVHNNIMLLYAMLALRHNLATIHGQDKNIRERTTLPGNQVDLDNKGAYHGHLSQSSRSSD